MRKERKTNLGKIARRTLPAARLLALYEQLKQAGAFTVEKLANDTIQERINLLKY